MTEQELRAKLKAILAAHGMGDFGASQCSEAILDLIDERDAPVLAATRSVIEGRAPLSTLVESLTRDRK